MKPIRLLIAGLNSFKESQEIDFGRLCEGNVFGIFGPTGSGKSTVVDAITLALYGTVKRASRKTQGIVNKALSEASVLFEWQLGGGTERKTYRVERKYVAKDESVTCRLARLCQLQGEETIVLADKPSQVDQAVQDILGLTEDDFTRAVVLPQGRFAEFLNLQGSERRRMLERIFGLEEYGEQLNRLVGERLKAAENSLQAIEHSQAVLGAAQLADVAAAEEQVRLGSAELAASRTAFGQIAADRDHFGRVRERQQELEHVNLSLQELQQQASQVTLLSEQLQRHAAAERISSLLQTADIAAGREQETDLALRQQSALLAQLEQSETTAQRFAATALQLLQEQEAPLQKRLEQLERAIRLEQRADALAKQLAIKLQLGQSLTAKVDAQAAALEMDKTTALELARAVENLQREMVQNQIEPLQRERLATAVAAQEKCTQAAVQLQEIAAEHETRRELLTVASKQLCRARELMAGHQQAVHSQQALLAELAAAAPASVASAELQQASAYQADAQQLGFEQQALGQLQQSLLTLEQSLVQLREQAEHGQTQLSEAEAALATAANEVSDLGHDLDAARDRNMAALLSRNLQPDQPCPVCGSMDHPRPVAGIDDSQLVQLELILDSARARLQAEQERRAVAQADLANCRRELVSQLTARESCAKQLQIVQGRLQALLDELPPAWTEGGNCSELPQLAQQHMSQLTELIRRRTAWQAQLDQAKELLQSHVEQVNSGQQQVSLLQQTMANHQSEVAHLQGKQNALLAHQAQLQAELAVCLAELDTIDLDATRTRYQQMDRQFARLDRQLRQKREARDELAQSVAADEQALNGLREQQAQARTEYRLEQATLEELQAELTSLTGGMGAVGLRDSTERQLAELREAARIAAASFEQARRQVTDCRQSHGIRQEAFRLASLDLVAVRAKLQQALERERFVSREEAEEALSWADLVPTWQRQISEHQSRSQILRGRSETLVEQLDGQSISEASWQELQQQAEAAAAAQEQAVATLAQLQESCKQLRQRHQQWTELEQERTRLAGERNLLGELVSLLRGNALVEFMASEHLDAIAGIATDWLGLLTGRRYALEIAPDGGFLIRDDGNGGERRPVYTLSGGETFVTSLALALALSSQVQLRGKHHLEFFFLDEGFGSLDPDLLEVVMGCLERMRGQEMSIGLISHVPELRERILRQVQVTPAEPGGRGSRVRLTVG